MLSKARSQLLLRKTSSEIICQNLGVQSQTIFQDYRCTYKDKISYFGRLYVGEEHIMFVSNMFGVLKKITIPFSSISRLEQTPQNSITLTGLRLEHNALEQFVFTGLQNNHAFRIINAVWRKEKLQASMMSNEEQQKENAESKQHLDSSQIEISLLNGSGAERERVKMLQIVLPCSVQQFYAFFLADHAQLYGRRKHLEIKNAHSIEVSGWRRNEELSADTREVTAVIRVKGVPLMSQARMSQVCILSRNQRREINLKIITNMSDVPYHSYFNCQEYITVGSEGDHKCRYTVHAAIIFNKTTYMKNTIISKTFIDFNDDYKLWSDNCKKHLEAKRMELERVKKDEHRDGVLAVQFEADKQEVGEVQDVMGGGKGEGRGQSLDECLRQLADIKKEMERMRFNQKLQNVLISICILLLVGFAIPFGRGSPNFL